VKNCVAVTGAAGFVGRALTAHLVREGYRVRALVRDWEGPTAAGAERVVVPGLTDPSVVHQAIDGCACVFHTAGLAHRPDDGSERALARFREGIVGPTSTVLDAIAKGGAGALVVLSSVAAVRSSDPSPITDLTPPAPGTAYGLAKLEADALVAERARSDGFAAVVLRPPALYGAGMRGNPLRLFNLVRRGFPLPVGRVQNQRSMMYVDNLVVACAAAWRCGLRGIFLISDPVPHSTAEWARLIASALGVRPRVYGLSPRLLVLAARLAACVPVSAISRGAAQLDRLVGSVHVVDEAFRRALPAPLPCVDEREALARTADWFVGS
jgi:nucleoside-diphosphate-sugar epimerase